MDEAIKSIKAFLYDRTVSPLFGAYMLAWLIWNYRVFVVLLDSKELLTAKLENIDRYFGPLSYNIFGYSFQIWGQIVHGVLGPILLTVIYLYIYPWFAKPVYSHSLAKQKELKAIKQEIENARLLSVDESRVLIKEIEQLRLKADEDANRYRERISSLSATISELENKQKVLLPNTDEPAKTNLPPELSLDEFLSIDEFKELVKRKVSELQDVEFELNDLFDENEWQRLDSSDRQKYGKQFRAFVERGEIKGVSIGGKRAGNQLYYRKGSSTSLPEKTGLESELISRFPANSFIDNAFDSDDARIHLLKKLSAYCDANNLSGHMFEILFLLVLSGGKGHVNPLKERLKDRLTTIEVDHLLRQLVNNGLISENVYKTEVELTDKGKEMAVSSGLTLLDKSLRK